VRNLPWRFFVGREGRVPLKTVELMCGHCSGANRHHPHIGLTSQKPEPPLMTRGLHSQV